MPRAAVCTAVRKPLEVMDLILDGPRAGEIRVRLRASGVCGSDVSVAHGHLPSPLPVVLGHEGAGVVIEVGEGVTTVGVGDHVVVAAMPQCGECFRCRRGQPSLCEVSDGVLLTGAMRDGTTRFSAGDGAGVHQFVAAGTFAEEVVVSAISAVRIPADVAFAPVSKLGCGALTGFGAAVNAAGIEAGHTVCVIGCGSVGLSAVQGARIAGAAEIIAIDLVAAKQEVALQLGATAVVDGGHDVVAVVKGLTGGRGVDVAIECVGAQSTVEAAIAMTGRGGEIVFVGAGGKDTRVNVAQFSGLVGCAKTFKGVLFGQADIQRDIPRMVAHYQAGELELDRLVSAIFSLDEINEGLAALSGGDVVSAVVAL